MGTGYSLRPPGTSSPGQAKEPSGSLWLCRLWGCARLSCGEHLLCEDGTGKAPAVAHWLLYPQLQEGRSDRGAVLPCLACPQPSLPLPRMSEVDGAASCTAMLHLTLILPSLILSHHPHDPAGGSFYREVAPLAGKCHLQEEAMGCPSPGDTEGWCSAGDLLHAMLGSWDPPCARHYHAGSDSGGVPSCPPRRSAQQGFTFSWRTERREEVVRTLLPCPQSNPWTYTPTAEGPRAGRREPMGAGSALEEGRDK